MISFVIVHIGKKEFPKHIYDCVGQIRCFHKKNDIYLAVNRSVKNMDMDRLNNLNCKIVYIETLKKSRKHRKWSWTTRLKKFWKYAAERFFVVEEVMESFDLEHVVHLESDNLIYYDWNRLEDELENCYPTLSAPADSDERCVAGVMWINTRSALNDLTNYLCTREAKQMSNEMFMLAKYMKLSETENLPVVSDQRVCGKSAEKYMKNVEDLQGIFDAAAIGQYIGGEDKRGYIDILNGKYEKVPEGDEKIVPVINKNLIYDVEKMDIHWIRNEEGKYIPVAGETKIYNLHIHSKELSKYLSVR